ncbi:MAG TPA: sugar phosphate nucleotidyltransferase [Polyangia bacterium]
MNQPTKSALSSAAPVMLAAEARHGGEPASPIARDRHLWAIVLAAGEGTRMAALTTALHGRAIPKQFASLFGTRTFIQRTVDRILPLVPASRIVVVVADNQYELATSQLAEFRGIAIVRQPANRGTSAGVLLPLAHVLARDPDARVVVFPSDHHIERPSQFARAIRHSIEAADSAAMGVSLVGSVADGPATDLGWIVCHDETDEAGRPPGPGRRVSRFVEKPALDEAVELHRRGALWNTFILSARGCALWVLASRHVPAVALALGEHQRRIGGAGERRHLEEIYSALPSTDLSRDVLQRGHGLHAVAMTDAGWSDCGTPDRLARATGSHAASAFDSVPAGLQAAC